MPFEVAVTCAHCDGDGAEPGSDRDDVPDVRRRRPLQQVSRSVFGEFVRTQACPTCGGSGRKIETPCTECSGAGRVLERAHARGRDPRGHPRRPADPAHAARATRACSAARAGDVYVQVHVQPDPRFVREGNDIFSTVDLTMTQAALGATVTIPTLDGDDELEFAAGHAAGRGRSCCAGTGMPVLQGFGRGDHRVLVNVLVPRHLNDEQRRLLEEFDVARGRDDVPAPTRASSRS